MPHPSRSAIRIGGGFMLAVAIAACAGSTTSSSLPPVAASAATSAASAAAGVSSTPNPEATPATSLAIPSLGATTPLVDILPGELGGATTNKVALVGSDLSALDSSAAMIFEGVLGILQAKGADMTVGAASNAKASVIAIRVKGASAEEIGDAMVAGRTLNATTTKDEVDLGGKQVLKVTTTIAPVPFYVYGTGDVSFTISAADESIVAEALSKLP